MNPWKLIQVQNLYKNFKRAKNPKQKQKPEEDSCSSSCCHPELYKASLSCNCFSLQFFRFLEGSRAASIVLRSGLMGGQSTLRFLLHRQCVWIVTFLKNQAAPSQMICTQNQLKMFKLRFFPPSDVLPLIKLTVLQLSSLHLSVKDLSLIHI